MNLQDMLSNLIFIGGTTNALISYLAVSNEVIRNVALGIEGRLVLNYLEKGGNATEYRWLASDIRMGLLAQHIMGREKLTRLESYLEPST